MGSQTDLYKSEQRIRFLPFVGLLAGYVWMVTRGADGCH